MPIPYNRTNVISVALTLLGFPPIQSITAGGQSAAVIDGIYDVTLAADLASPNWRFATKVQTLSQIAGVDPDFMYFNTAYQIPVDCLAIWQIYPNVPYEVFGERIWTTGTQQLQMQYRAVVAESFLPPTYIMYFCYLLACTVGPAITDNPKILAQLNADMTKWRAQAMVVDSQGRPNIALTNSPWVNARYSGNFGNRGGW